MTQPQRRRRRPWLCGGGGSDTEEGPIQSTLSKTLNKKKPNGTNSSGGVDSRTGTSSSGGDESSSNSGNDSRDQIELNIPAWRAGTFLSFACLFLFYPSFTNRFCYFAITCPEIENFLEAPLVEDDWWESENDNDGDDDDDDESSISDSINEKVSATRSDGDDDDDESCVATYIMRLQQQYTHAVITKTPSSWENNEHNSNERSDTSTSNNDNEKKNSSQVETIKDRKRFCNRGLQTWYLARQKWLTTSEHNEALCMKTKKPSSSPIIPDSFRKELKQCLIDRRLFELSQSIPLSCVVNVYEEVWKENGCD